uniref:PGG domain-containing protein n=1 Tax=Nelumbo nucifera TaxID=4432 RepID=A0A822Z9H6_NELNU|nr:TPA_asm: hypothetical protein HUJ06_014352 [Nelumbo nucifera]
MGTPQQQANDSTPKHSFFRMPSVLKKFLKVLYRDYTHETRNVLLVVAALIATVSFQAGVNPPGGVWQDDDGGHKAGRSIYADHPVAFSLFLTANTLGLSASINIIAYLTYGFPLYMEVLIAIYSMIGTYASAVVAVTPKGSVKFRYILIAAAIPYALRFGKQQWFFKEDTTKNLQKGPEHCSDHRPAEPSGPSECENGKVVKEVPTSNNNPESA